MTAPGQRRGEAILAATGLGLFMVVLDATIVNVALPSIQSSFDAGESGIQWVVAAYSLTMTMFIMAGASFGDTRGRRLGFIIGIIVFCSASIVCGLAPSITVLNVARGVQGIGAAMVNVASLALVVAAFPGPKEKARAIGIWTGIAAIGVAIGPTLGGILTTTLGWRSVFMVNPVIGVVAIILTLRVVKESRDPVSRGFDPAGQGLFIVGIGALAFALIQGSQFGWTSDVILVSFAVALLGLGVFVWWELRGSNPMMDVRLFGNRVYSAAVYTLFAVLFCGYGTLLVVTQFFQNVEGYTPIAAGILMLAFSLPYMVLAPLAGRLVTARGPRGPTLLGIGLVALGVGTFAASSTSVLPVTLLALFLIGAGNGVGVAAATSVAMVDVPGDRAGMASGMLSAQRALGSTAGFAIMGSILATVVAIVLPVRLEPVIPDQAIRDQVVSEVVAEANPQALTAMIAPKEELPLRVRQSEAALEAAESAFVAGVRIAMLVGFLVIASAFVIGWRVFPRRPRARAPAPTE